VDNLGDAEDVEKEEEGEAEAEVEVITLQTNCKRVSKVHYFR